MDGLTVIEKDELFPQEKKTATSLDQMTLGERTDLLSRAYSFVESSDEKTEEEMEIIAKFEKAVDDKIAAWGLVIKKFNEAVKICLVEADFYEKKAEICKKKAGIYQNNANRMKLFLKNKMVEYDTRRISTPRVSVRLRKLPQKVEIIDGGDIETPEHDFFVTEKVVKKWNKKSILAKLKQGQLFKTAKLSTQDFNVIVE